MPTVAIAVCSLIAAPAGAVGPGQSPDWLVFHSYPELRSAVETIPRAAIDRATRTTGPHPFKIAIAETRAEMRAVAEEIKELGHSAVLVTSAVADVAPYGYLSFVNQVIAGAGADPLTDVTDARRLDARCALIELSGGDRETVLVAVSGPDVTEECIARVLTHFMPEARP